MLRLVRKEGGEIRMTLGERLRTAREKVGLGLRDMATHLAYSESHLFYVEAGRRRPSVELLSAICDMVNERSGAKPLLNFKQLLLIMERETEAKQQLRRARKTELRLKLAGKQAVTDVGGKAGT